MKLSVGEAASLLGVEEQRVYDWIEERALPAQRIRGQYRINRAELLEWATERRVAVSPRAFQQERGAPTLTEALRAGGVNRDVPSASIQEALRHIVGKLSVADEADRDMLLEILVAREAVGITPVGDGIAIPHVRTPIILDSVGAIVSLSFLTEPIDLDAPDSRPVDTFFFLICPTVHVHLAMLARLAHALRDAAFRAAVHARDPEAILSAASALEGSG